MDYRTGYNTAPRRRRKKPRSIFKRFLGFTMLFVLSFAVLLAAAYFIVQKRYPVMYLEEINSYSGRFKTEFILAVIHTESKFNVNAVSHKGASGLMQLSEATAEWMASEMKLRNYQTGRIFEPELNIAIGCYFLNWLADYYNDDITLILCAYNAGMGNVNKWLQDSRYSDNGKTLSYIPFEETRQYVQRVAASQRIYEWIRR